MRKLLGCFLMFALLALALSNLPVSASAEAPGEMASAQKISVNQQYTDNISDSKDIDYYKFTLSSAGHIHLNFKHQNLFNKQEYWQATIYDENTNPITSYSFSGTETDKTTYKVGLDKGTYYIRITGGTWYDWNGYSESWNDANYSFTVKYTKTAYWEKENNEDYTAANKLVLNKQYGGTINRREDIDFYKVTLTSAGSVYLNFKHKNLLDSTEYWVAYLYDENTNPITSYSFSGTETDKTTHKVGLDKGTYYIRITGGTWYDWNGYSESWNDATYSFTVKYTKTAYWEKENNESYAAANKLTLNKKYGGTINNSEDVDFYKFTLSKKSSVSIKLYEKVANEPKAYYAVEIYDASTNKIANFSVCANDSMEKLSLTLKKGTYYIKVYGADWRWNCSHCYSTKDYGLTVAEIKPGKVSKVVAKPKSSEIKLTWNAAKDASGYCIYQYNFKTKKYTAIKTVSGKSLTVKNLKANTKYRFKVKAYTFVGTDVLWSELSATIDAKTCPAKVSKLTAKQTTSAIKLTWSKVSGAKGYKVYRYTGGKWKEIKATTSTTYTVKKLKAGTKYRFAVKAYTKYDGKTLYSSSYKEISTATKAATPTITKITSTVKGKATLNWKNVSGESGYQVYYATSKKGTYKRYSRTSTNDIKETVSKLKSGKTYYFKVRAYTKTTSGTVYSAYSTVKGIKVK